MDKIGFALLIIIVVLCYLFFFKETTPKIPNSSDEDDGDLEEGMAPLNYGTYQNNYPRGRCKSGSMKRTSCEVGSCPLGTTVTNERYCGIQCAQDPDPESRADCYAYCMDMMENGCA